MPDYILNKMPAVKWEDALPLGNGHIGAMVYGNVQRECILLNHEELFRYSSKPVYNPFHVHLDELRTLLLEGRHEEGDKFLQEKFKQCCIDVNNVDPYQPFANLFLYRRPKDAFTDYSSVLDFASGSTLVSWNEAGAVLTRQSFVSYDEGVVCTRFTSDNGQDLDLQVYAAPVEDDGRYISFKTEEVNECLHLAMSYANGRNHGLVVYVKTEGGEKHIDKDRFMISGAKVIDMFVKLYIYEDAKQSADKISEDIKGYAFDVLYEKHSVKWNSMYNAVSFKLETDNRDLCTEQLLLDAYQDKRPINLFHTMFNYGRYLLIAASSKKGLPINLQGIWNGTYNPPWDSDIHTDENVQMCYWAALPLGLFDSAMALYDYFDSMISDFQENAKKIFNCRGILITICMNTHGQINGTTGKWQVWASAAGWIASHYYDYWLFTKDIDFLENRALPFMRQTALFYEDFLIEGDDGKLVFVPSMSPENAPAIPDTSIITVNATMDVAVAKECLTNLISTCKLLNKHLEEIDTWQSILDRLPEYEINQDGAFKEWLYTGLEDNYYQRHQSHIYPLFPGFEITKETDMRLYGALKTAVDKRLMIGFVEQTGWSYAHMANIYARLQDGQSALECLNYILRSCTGNNLFTYHNDWRDQGLTVYWFGKNAPFQIDANLGFTAAVLEMLVFSTPGFIRILPALPVEWSKGSIGPLHTRSGAKCSIEWDIVQGHIEVKLVSQVDQQVQLELPFDVEDIEVEGCELKFLKKENAGSYYELVLKKEQESIIKVQIAVKN